VLAAFILLKVVDAVVGLRLLQRLATQERLPFLLQTNKRLTEGEDLDFVRARKEFQDLYSVSTLFAVHPRSEVRVSSPFRGVVLE